MSTDKSKPTYACRYCKQPVSKGDRRCPHCGTLNPTMDAKRAFVWTVGSIFLLYFISWIIDSKD